MRSHAAVRTELRTRGRFKECAPRPLRSRDVDWMDSTHPDCGVQIGEGWLTLAGGAAYLVTAADLPVLDAADGRTDGRIFLSNVVRMRY